MPQKAPTPPLPPPQPEVESSLGADFGLDKILASLDQLEGKETTPKVESRHVSFKKEENTPPPPTPPKPTVKPMPPSRYAGR